MNFMKKIVVVVVFVSILILLGCGYNILQVKDEVVIVVWLEV